MSGNPTRGDALNPPMLDVATPVDAGAERPQDIPRAAQLVLRMMDKLAVGSLTVRLPNGDARHFGHGAPHAQVSLANWNVCEAALRSGDIGFGETFIAGDWSTPDLPVLMHVMVSNRNALEAVIYGTWWGRVAYRLRHVLRRNSRAGSKKNIHAHYDIGNAFYRLWLDESMTYSSALFGDGIDAADASVADDHAVLERAQHAKNARILDELALDAGGRVLEIGCGWGGFAQAAAAQGLGVHGLTLSNEQLDLARERIAAAGHDERVSIEIRDYRDVDTQYDGIVSVEMFEAVGEQYWSDYFRCLKRSLKPGGRAVVQTITIDEMLFDAYRKSSDFIQQYIFPGGMLPSKDAFAKAAQRAGLVIVGSHPFGHDYARTLLVWYRAFHAREAEVRAQGFDVTFTRIWSFYLAYCAAAFRNGNTDVVQFTLAHRPE